MGTRSLTIVKDEDGRKLLTLYRQMDGYPTGHGQELADFLKPIKLVNGISNEKEPIANGMGCLAAQIVAHFKRAAGGFYIMTAGDHGQDYVYTVSTDEKHRILLSVQNPSKKILDRRPVELYDGKRLEALESQEA